MLKALLILLQGRREDKMNKAFVDVGVEAGLEGKTLERYVEYMLKRWKSTEELECRTGYAAQWARHFPK